MSERIIFTDAHQAATVFCAQGHTLWLEQLCGLPCGLHGSDLGPRSARGLAVLETPGQRYEAADFHLIRQHFTQNEANFAWQAGASGLTWESAWSFDAEAGVWRRRDRLVNSGDAPVHITRCLARIPFAPGAYGLYTQASNWAHESQGGWRAPGFGRLTLRSQGGRTNQGASPYLFIAAPDGARSAAIHLAPLGNWVIHLDQTRTPWDESAPFLTLELGHSDDLLFWRLPAGQALDLPEIFIQGIPGGRPEAGAAIWQAYALRLLAGDSPAPVKPRAPLVYNTWFDRFDQLATDRLRAQLAAARDLGCEVFTIDAGWYGNGAGDWHKQVGDWEEKRSGALRGQMAAFAAEVRAAGLGFGLWVEPERLAPAAPIRLAHPGWFLPGDDGFAYPDLANPAVYEYVRAELARLVETYQLAWMKMDFNFELGSPADGLYGYYTRWYALVDDLRLRYPNTFFEGCASGGMRLDLNTLTHIDGHFLTDTVNPVETLRIAQSTALRLPLGRLTRWAVLRGPGQPGVGDERTVLVPANAGWDNAYLADIDFVCRAALPGLLGLSGDLTHLPAAARERLRQHLAFFKTWRDFLAAAVTELLTPIAPASEVNGWVGFEMRLPGNTDAAMLCAYRLRDGGGQHIFHWRGLAPAARYALSGPDLPPGAERVCLGSEWMEAGLLVSLGQPYSAGVFILRRLPD